MKVERFIMDDLILLPAGPDYKYQYLRFVSECANDIRRTGFSYALLLSTEESFEADMQRISDNRLGIGLPEGYVPESVYWLYWRSTDRMVGAILIRHRLTAALTFRGGHIAYYIHPSERHKGIATRMLSDGLDICRRMGLSKVLITCAKENLPSAKTIRSNGGVLDSEDTDNGEIFERYWITL